jgi:hypothetical protein
MFQSISGAPHSDRVLQRFKILDAEEVGWEHAEVSNEEDAE